MSHGRLTAKTARYLSQFIEKDGYNVLFDHGDPSEDPIDHVGEISSWFGEKLTASSQLALLDIAIVETETSQAVALFEIEETSSTPKIILGDAFGTLLGDHITFQAKRPLVVGEFTTLIILLKQPKGDQSEKIDYLQTQLRQLSKYINTGNARVGRLYIDTFSNELELMHKAKYFISESLVYYKKYNQSISLAFFDKYKTNL